MFLKYFYFIFISLFSSKLFLFLMIHSHKNKSIHDYHISEYRFQWYLPCATLILILLSTLVASVHKLTMYRLYTLNVFLSPYLWVPRGWARASVSVLYLGSEVKLTVTNALRSKICKGLKSTPRFLLNTELRVWIPLFKLSYVLLLFLIESLI